MVMAASAASPLPLLTLLLLLPLVGAMALWLVPNPQHSRWAALVTAAVELGLGVAVLLRFDASDPGFQLVERAHWIPTLNVHYLVGVDGISVLFLPLAALIFAAAIVASWTSVRTLPRLYYALLLLLEGSTLGIFMALDTMLFFLFWELTLIPLYFLISLWGIGPNRRYAAASYTLFMLAGGVPLLFGFIVLAYHQGEASGIGIPAGLVFDYVELLRTPLAPAWQEVVFFLLLLGFAVKVPLFPFHTWLPVVAKEGPAAVAALLTGLKLGAYGIIRFLVPLTPLAVQRYHWLLAGLGVVGVLYGALGALGQTNLRRMLAFSSMSHVGLVILGVAAFNIQGIQGAVFQLLNFTVVAGGLFLLAGSLHHRIGSTDVISLGGVARTMPMLAAFFLLFGFASMGVPGTNGFPAEHLILIGTLQRHLGAGMAALFGVVLTAGYFLSSYRRSFLGPVRSTAVADAVDLRPRELALAVLLALVLLAAGFWPQGVLDVTQAASGAWVERLGGAL
jgi:NADH-quinone oxidoreductase subunit M